jgi:hypothetical protein
MHRVSRYRYWQIKGTIENLSCQKIQAKCEISFETRNLDLIENCIVSLKLYEAQSLCSWIFLKVENSSSIPGEVSTISNFILSDYGQYFRGSIPSTFSYLMTPSLFKTDSDILQDDHIGYHILPRDNPLKGSQVNVS